MIVAVIFPKALDSAGDLHLFLAPAAGWPCG